MKFFLIGIFSLLLINSYGQIRLYEIPWWGDEKKEVFLDSVLTMSFELFLQDTIKTPQDLPFYDIQGRPCKVFCLYNGQIIFKDFIRMNFGNITPLYELVSETMDKTVNAMLPHLKLKPKTMYMLNVYINVNLNWCKEGEAEYDVIKYEKEKKLFGEKEYHVITIAGCRKFPPDGTSF